MLASSDRVTVVGTADGGREAVEKARELMPDVVLMDVQMPDVDGAEATRRITAAIAELTHRERDLLAALVQGMANKQIAGHLAISEKAVKAHLSGAFRRIGVTGRAQAALWAERNGIAGDAPEARW